LKQPQTKKVVRDDVSSWNNTYWPCGRPKTGIFYQDAIGQSEFLWYCRTIPNIKKAFSTIWGGEEDLLTSFDGCGAFRPPEVSTDWLTSGGWYHVDQNGIKKKYKCCIQGLLNFLPSTQADGGLLLLPKSHQLFEQLFMIDGKTPHSDFYMIPKSSRVWSLFETCGLKMTKLILAPGDLVLWDSRTIHCNTPASLLSKEERPTHPDLRRLVSYICMTPTKFATQEVIFKRIAAYKKGTTTNHWPHEFGVASENTDVAYKPISLTQNKKF